MACANCLLSPSKLPVRRLKPQTAICNRFDVIFQRHWRQRSVPMPFSFMRPPLSLKARALKYLSMREHSRLELARKLSRHAQEGDDVEALLNWLEAAKFLSQERFAESLVNRRAARFGNSRIL